MDFLNQKIFLQYKDWLFIFIIILIGLVTRIIATKYSIAFLKKVFKYKHFTLPPEKFKKISFSISLISFNIVWINLIKLINMPENLMSVLFISGKVILNTGIIFFCYHMTDTICLYLQERAKDTENKFDDILIPLINKTFKTFIIIFGVILLGDTLELDVKSLIAGLGIGGIAFALAAKDTISNLFGSITVIFDRPFHIGDWVVIDKEIEGAVEEVGLRSCRIRTFEDSLITLPNGKLTNAYINNFGRRSYRRHTAKIGLVYSTTTEEIESFCEAIKQYILNHPKTNKTNFFTYLNEMGDFSLNILVSLLFKVQSKREELQEIHKFYIFILKLAKKQGLEFAFPTQTIEISKS